ncbi:cyclic-di-AMP receptor [Nitrolancea hollandica]|jgi:uncharacterized protein YaaQ|uniref:Nitrogen regulatory protein P-II n=1 Tax=Nitrolancea hollandica Lb TaxID=1129897 RepID=I4EF77_9BACT|nr:cyclic-di-AMP receptor [Nitrolancea hollandica]CCF83339.1 conserved hypothetical protein [Nitrolancea hollandica Lb]
MKLIFAVIQGKDVENLLTALREAGYRSTQINSAGGFLRENNVTVLIGVDDLEVPDIVRIIKQNCYSRTQYVNPLLPIMEPGEFYMPDPVEVQIGGAMVFVLDVQHYESII